MARFPRILSETGPWCLVLLTVFGSIPSRLQAQGTSKPEIVAVLDLESRGASALEAAGLTERLREEILKTGRFTIADRSNIDAALNELALQQTGCTSQECAVRVGRFLGVRKIVVGRVIKYNSQRWQISAQMIDVETTETLQAESIIHEGDFVSLLRTGIATLASKLAGLTATPVVPSPSPSRSPAVGVGDLYIATTPPGAEIVLDGKGRKERSDVLLKGIPAGDHNVVVSKDYLGAAGTVTVVPGKVARLELSLEPKPGSLLVTTQPFGAQIILDGREIGTSPVRTEVPAGRYRLEIRLRGYASVDRWMEVIPGRDNEVDVTLQPSGIVKFYRLDPEATIEIDNVQMQAANQEIALPPGEYRITISRPGYHPMSKHVGLRAGETVTLSANLTPTPTTLEKMKREAVESCKSRVEFGTSDSPSSFFHTSGWYLLWPIYPFWSTTYVTQMTDCNNAYGATAELDLLLFVAHNHIQLQTDFARGGGEYLSSLGALLGCTDTERRELAEITQLNFESYLISPDSTPIAYLQRLKSILRQSPTLAEHCSYVSS